MSNATKSPHDEMEAVEREYEQALAEPNEADDATDDAPSKGGGVARLAGLLVLAAIAFGVFLVVFNSARGDDGGGAEAGTAAAESVPGIVMPDDASLSLSYTLTAANDGQALWLYFDHNLPAGASVLVEVRDGITDDSFQIRHTLADAADGARASRLTPADWTQTYGGPMVIAGPVTVRVVNRDAGIDEVLEVTP